MNSVCTWRHGRSTSAPSKWSRPRRPRRRARRVSATSAAASTSPSRTSHGISKPLDVEPDLEHVSVLHLVLLPLDPQLAQLLGLGPRADVEELGPLDHLGP